MRLIKFTTESDSTPRVGLLNEDRVVPLASGPRALSEILHAGNVRGAIEDRLQTAPAPIDLATVVVQPPIDAQEVWGAGVTYERSKVARQEESEQGGSFYDLVYRAARPELFFKATPSRVVGPNRPIRVRSDTRWCVPEPELALVVSPKLDLVGFTIGNDVSARDIEGENPLYLPQAKVYDASCALGPAITLAAAMPPVSDIEISLAIERNHATAWSGTTSAGRMVRTFRELIDWLGRDNPFPDGLILLTGTGIVPPDDFSLQRGDLVRITISGIGTLENSVVQSDRTGAVNTRRETGSR
jgi:2-dehydro-3-deoxy-D-arabinonate dehydratase